MSTDFTYEYLPWRGITEHTFKFYDVKTKVDAEGKPISIGFKQPNGAYLIRSIAEKEFYWEKEIPPVPGLGGTDKFASGSNKVITITEGGLDALSLHQVLRTPVVYAKSASTAGADCAADRTYLQGFERIYLAFDNDGPGRDAVRQVAKLFDYNKVFQVKFSNRKDANEYLEAGEEIALRSIWNSSKRYLPETVISSFSDFKKILSEPTKEGIPYPFRTLTSMTYGIRTSECVLITAQEGVGKTEIMHAIEHKLLKETDNAIGAIFLEEPKKRHLQAIAGLELKLPVHLPDSGVSEDQVFNTIQTVVGTDDRLHIYSHFGSDDPDVLIDTIRFLVSARGCKYILLDHITMAVSGISGEADERRALDYLSTRLAMMTQELDFALIFVSHVNDNGQTRGSRNIAKIAHVRIDATRNILALDEVERRTIYLSISKNRPAWKTGQAGRVIFDPLTCTLGEVSNDNDFTQSESRRQEPPASSERKLVA